MTRAPRDSNETDEKRNENETKRDGSWRVIIYDRVFVFD
jgi:hypothetical protein